MANVQAKVVETEEGAPVLVKIGNAQLWANPKTFSTGKTGWGAYGRITGPDGQPAQVSCNIVTIEPKAK